MLGNTLVLPVTGGSITMVKVNNGEPYSSEYLFRDTGHEFRARIRHTKTKATALRPSYDRHNFEVVETIFPVDSTPGFERKFYFVLEQLPQDQSVLNADAVADLMIATSDAFLTALVGWES
jgi:hypothetical protein